MSLSRRDFLKALGIMATFPSMASAATLPDGQSRYAVAGTIITGDETPPLRDHAAVVNQGVIKAVIPLAQAHDLHVIAPPDATILPGIINCHVHRIHSAQERRERYLNHGVTAIGDAASPLRALPQLTDNPPGATATAACSGPMLCPPDGYPLPVHGPKHGMIVRSPAHGRKRVKQLADAGAGMVKLAFEPGPYPTPWPLFDLPTASAICDEARKFGMTVRCHVEDFGSLETALEAGVDVIDHVPHRWIKDGKPQSILTGTEGELIPAYMKLLERMAREQVILVPTLDVLSRSLWNGPELSLPVAAFAHMGGTIAVGNDHPYRRTDAGMPIREMHLLCKAGLKTKDILRAGTAASARACGFTNRGELKQGMAADMLVVQADPLTDLEAISHPLHVIKDGVFITKMNQ